MSGANARSCILLLLPRPLATDRDFWSMVIACGSGVAFGWRFICMCLDRSPKSLLVMEGFPWVGLILVHAHSMHLGLDVGLSSWPFLAPLVNVSSIAQECVFGRCIDVVNSMCPWIVETVMWWRSRCSRMAKDKE